MYELRRALMFASRISQEGKNLHFARVGRTPVDANGVAASFLATKSFEEHVTFFHMLTEFRQNFSSHAIMDDRKSSTR